jgi:ABC-type sugar transport system ATPase subunit
MQKQNQEPIIRLRDITKMFGSVIGLDKLDLDIYPEQVLAIVGNNGAGKSTLVKVLSGAYSVDSGEITMNGKTFNGLTPSLSIKEGIVTVYQDLSLVDTRDVASNIFLGREYCFAGFWINREKMKHEAGSILSRLNIEISDMDAIVGELSGGQRQCIAIAKAISQGGKVIILDEPTAALGVRESKAVLDLILELKGQKYTILVVSHNLTHVLSVADRLCFIRHGRVVEDVVSNETSVEEISHRLAEMG